MCTASVPHRKAHQEAAGRREARPGGGAQGQGKAKERDALEVESS